MSLKFMFIRRLLVKSMDNKKAKKPILIQLKSAWTTRQKAVKNWWLDKECTEE